MPNLKKPSHLPECELINNLIKKTNKQHCDFNFLAYLDIFREKVACESKFIVQIFPEYTPHDIEYHLNNLFKIADTLLGKKHYESMNTSELFLLCIGLYGHDWGMAVSAAQKEQLLSQLSTGTGQQISEGLLNDEGPKFLKFLHEQGYSFSQFTSDKSNADELWSKYIRETHAERSGERVKQFFSKIDTGIAESSELICKGHSIKFELLEDDELYPTHTSILGEPVNLKAISIYCRLIDLFDFADNRTPYVLWKYVSPENPVSKMEWAKHRALRQITCQGYNKQRRIIVNGNTNDHEVFAALNDLHSYCNEQLRRSQGIFARMNDPRHDFDIFDINWKVKPEGFEPISIQFEFDRQRMFTILSDEIYQGDPYVFLRELLQNSIDAIKVRKKIWQDQDKSNRDIGCIKVFVKREGNGDTEIMWCDDGIGMDEHIIRNYLAVAGKSYYVSEEFEKFNKIGIAFDPISKYGIGILTCFLVADQIEILTYRDPYNSPKSVPLKIIIPDKTRQFRIEKIYDNYPEVGTIVRIYVKGKKLDQIGIKDSFNVTEYLKIVAGFVDFPIIIEESLNKTVILHPNNNPEDAIKKYGKGYQIFQLSKRYPWKDVIIPQDLHDAEEVFTEKTIDISTDLKLIDYEGWITYLIPKNDNVEITGSFSSSNGSYFFRDRIKEPPYYIRWEPNWGYDGAGQRFGSDYFNSKKVVTSPSSKVHNAYRVYNNGIFIANVNISDHLISRSRTLPIPKIIVNIKRAHLSLDLSRNQIAEDNWFSPISKVICDQNLKELKKILLTANLPERWLGIGRLISINDIDNDDLYKPEFLGSVPLPFIENEGKIIFKEFRECLSEEITTIGSPFEKEFFVVLSNYFFERKQYGGVLSQWVGKPSLLYIEDWPEDIELSNSIENALKLSNSLINKFYLIKSIDFINPPWGGFPPLVQKKFKLTTKSQSKKEDDEILKLVVNDPQKLTPLDIHKLNDYFSKLQMSVRTPPLIQFPSKFQRFFGYGLDYLNLNHPITQKIVQTGVKITQLKLEGKLTPTQLGELHDVSYTFKDYDDELNYIDYPEKSEEIRSFWEVCRDHSIIDDEDITHLIPLKDEFIPNTLGKYTIRHGKKIKRIKKGRAFGDIIESI